MQLRFLSFAAAVCLFGLAASARAQTDEIQVYDGDLTPVGKFNLTWHNNYTPNGLATPAFPGANIADKSFNGVTEWAYGVTPWFEAGLYLPLYSHDKINGGTYDGFKLRALFAVPHAADRRFFYGANFEFSINQKNWDDNRFSSEVRPIIGWHLKPWDIIVNPIFDTAYDGVKNLEFVPAVRVAYNFSEDWALSAEEYADYGPISGFYSPGQQVHQLYGVVNHNFGPVEIETGVGVGLTDASDRVTLKLLVMHDFNKKPLKIIK
jgi:hypothetical protein